MHYRPVMMVIHVSDNYCLQLANCFDSGVHFMQESSFIELEYIYH